MTSSAFISYSRRNGSFADRLYLDLKRAGVDAWLDRSDIPFDRRWQSEIRAAIDRSTHFLLLASPESANSGEVRKELVEAEALQKSIITLRVAGAYEQLPDDWRSRQCIDFHEGYWERLADLLRTLRGTSTPLRSLRDLLYCQGTVKDGARELTGALSIAVAGRDYRGLPVAPSGFTMTWLVGPADGVLVPPPCLAVLLKFSGEVARRDTLVEVIEFLGARQEDDVWVLFVQGPRDAKGDHQLPLDAPHIWEDGVLAATRAMQMPFIRGKELHLFLESPQALVYEVASKLRDMARKHLYQFNYRPTCPADRYVPVLGPGPT